MSRDELQAALAEVRAVYAELAKQPIERACIARTECCQFQLTGLTPHLTKGEALVAAKCFRATGRKELPEPTDGVCPMLKRETGKCMIYADRPFGCRTHFCEAAGGPCKYKGKSMKDAHKGMGIATADFNALVGDLVAALDKAGVKTADKNALLGVLGPMKSDIVEKP